MPSWNEAANNIFLRALEHESSDGRRVFLDGACGTDAELRAEVESLLETREHLGGFLDSPAPGIAASIEQSVTAKLPGTQIGPYKLIRQLGRGGMGVVYEAEQVSVGRRVAIKILPFAALLNEAQLERFATEATAAARLQHSNIVTIYSVGCERGIHFIAMQLIEGPSLSQVITELRHERHPDEKQQESADTVVAKKADVLTRDEDGGHYRAVARIGREAAEALQYAHENGVLHRDIKPSNLLLDQTGHVWIADFGLARIEDESQLTRTGDILGTLHYMSPEQATGQRDQIDARADVYGLGATLYELATLRPVFDNEDRREVIKQVVAGNPVAPHEIDSRIPRPLSLVISKAMTRRLDERYESAQEMADDLQRFLDGAAVKAKPRTPLRRARAWTRRHRLASAAIVGLLVVALVLPISHHFFTRIQSDSQPKGDVMKLSRAAKVAATVAAMAIVTAGVNAKKPPKPPPVTVPNPSGLVVSAVTEDSITLDWTSGGGTTAGFIVAYKEGTRYPKSNLRGATKIDVGNVESYTVPNLLTDQIYSFRVCAVDSNEKRSSGVTVQGTTLSTPPELYQVLDNYADFVDNTTYLGLGASTVQPDRKVIITANAQINFEPWVLTGGEHFVGRMNDAGTVDTTFGTNGYHQMDILNDGDATLDYPSNPVVLPSGKVLVAGVLGGTVSWEATAWYLVQYNADGSLDTDFGGGDGVVVDSIVGAHVVKGVTVDVRPVSGKIVIAGDGALPEEPDNNRCFVVQYNDDGSRDEGFGLLGMTSFLPPGALFFDAYNISVMAKSVTILSDGRIAVAGLCYMSDGHILSSLLMFNENGTVDGSFGENGHAYVETWPEIGPKGAGRENFAGVVEQPDGKLLAYGQRSAFDDNGDHWAPYQRTMARFNADGSNDPSFGVNGVVLPEKAYPFEAYRAIGVQSDGKIVVLGWAHTSDIMQIDLFIERFNIDGSRDLSFDGTGRIEFSTPGSEMAYGMSILEDNTIVIGGTHTDVEPGGLSRGLLLYLVPMP